MSRRLAAFATVALTLTALADAGASRQQSQVSSGFGTLAGRVELVEYSNRAPLRRATVILSSESGKPPRTTATDKDGGYRFESVTAGNYRVSVEKAGFLCAVTAPEGGAGTSGLLSIASGSTQVVNFIARRAAALEGRLIEDTGKPIPGLTVTADRLADAAGQPEAERSYSAKTDDLGRFRVHTIPPGSYRVSATPPPPASGARLYYPGTEKPEDAGVLVVAPGQTIESLLFTVATDSLPAITAEAMATQELEAQSAPTRGGTWSHVSGRVTRSDTGQPIANAAVKLSTSYGALLRTAWTDGAGQFAFSRVMAGAYVLIVSADGYANPAAPLARPTGGGTRIAVADGERLTRELVLTPLSAIEGRVLDEFGDPAPGVVLRVSPRVAVVDPMAPPPARLTTEPTDDRGWFRVSGLVPGEYFLFAVPEPFARSGPAAFPITYFPGATSYAAATPIPMMAGMDVHTANLTLSAATTTMISGTVTDASGRRVPKALVTLSPIQDGPFKGMFRAPANADANGDFVFQGVPEGTYLVEAMGPGMLGRASLTIAAPSAAFVLALKPLSTARGRVTFDGDVPPTLRPNDAYSVVRFQPIGPTMEAELVSSRSGLVQADWTFQIAGLASSGVIRAGESATVWGWALSRVLLQGRDITDVPYDFESGDVDGLEVVLTKRVGGITGTVHDGAKALDRVSVVVFGADGDSGPYLSRTFRFAYTNESGAFTLRGLLPGRYFAVAVAVPRSSPEVLQGLRSTATLVVVSEGTDTAIKLTLVK